MKVFPQVTNSFHINIEELRGRKDPEALRAAAKEFEALFAYEMIKSMRQTTEMDESGFGKDTYMTLFDMELAKILADRGLGLKEMLLKGLDRQLKSDGQGAEAGTEAVPPQEPVTGTGASRAGVHAPHAAIPGPQGSHSHSGVPDGEPAMPVDGHVSSKFGMRKHPIYGDHRFHHGIDIAAPEGSAVTPYRGGRVVFSGERPGYGNMVVIDHGEGVISKYAHNRVNLVKEGDRVDENTLIAEVGSTGNSTGPHLHFEVRRNGEPLDPTAILAMK